MKGLLSLLHQYLALYADAPPGFDSTELIDIRFDKASFKNSLDDNDETINQNNLRQLDFTIRCMTSYFVRRFIEVDISSVPKSIEKEIIRLLKIKQNEPGYNNLITTLESWLKNQDAVKNYLKHFKRVKLGVFREWIKMLVGRPRQVLAMSGSQLDWMSKALSRPTHPTSILGMIR